jgi:hypothetical protein
MMNTNPPATAQLSKEETRLVRHVPRLIALSGALWTLVSLPPTAVRSSTSIRQTPRQ